MTNNLSWQDKGACLGHDVKVFFTVKGQSTKEAKRICRTCPVFDMCFEYAIENNPPIGVWAATTERERRKFVRIDERRLCELCNKQI